MLLYLIKKNKQDEIFPNSFYEAIVTMILKPDQDNTQIENSKPTSLVNIDAKILNKMIANWTQQYF